MKEMITSNASFNYTVNHYLNTKHFASLARNTQVNYEYSLKLYVKQKYLVKSWVLLDLVNLMCLYVLKSMIHGRQM